MANVGIKVDLDVSGVTSGARQASESISSISDAMEKVEETEPDTYGKLAYQKTRIQSHNARLNNDLRSLGIDPGRQGTGSPAFAKMDPEQNQRFKDLTEAIKKLHAHYKDRMDNGRYDEAEGALTHIDRLEGERHTLLKEAGASETKQTKEQDAMKALVFGHIANSLNDAFSKVVGSLDRTGIINQYGSGDILGARVAEKQRVADRNGGLIQTGATLAGALALAAGNPLLGIGLTATGAAINTAMHIPIKGEANEAAYAGLWQQHSADAMGLAELMGMEGPKKVKDAFNIAAEAAAKFGYSAEEGMDAMKKAAMQGLSKEDARKATEQVFDYERNTGADRGTLLSASLMASRYKMGNMLSAGWAGLKASGMMEKGQYGEFLQAMQKVIENGISKGFILSSEQVAQNLAMLSQIGRGSELWKGENGARRLSEMNAGIESTTGLRSTSDILAYSAAKEIWGKDDKGNDVTYNRIMEHIEAGISGKGGTDFFNKTMQLAYKAEGEGEEGSVERIRQIFSQNYTNANAIFDAWLKAYTLNGKGFEDDAELKELAKIGPPKTSSSPELEAAKQTQEIVKLWIDAGQAYWTAKMPRTLAEELKTANEELAKALLLGQQPKPSEPPSPIPKPAITGELELPGGGKVPTNQYGRYFGVVNEPGGKDFKAEMDYLMREIAGPYNRNDPTASPDLRKLYETFGTMTSGKYGQDTMLDQSEVRQLMPILSKIADSKGMTDALERLITTLERFKVIVE